MSFSEALEGFFKGCREQEEKYNFLDDGLRRTLELERQRRKHAWIQSYTGKKVFPLDLEADQICIEDIAHALSLICRYGGHCNSFFSVAEHSVYVMEVVAQRSNNINNLRWALLHDATEAYIADICRPLKEFMPEYCMIEDNCKGVIVEKFGLRPNFIPDIVKFADTSVLYAEKEQTMGKGPPWTKVDVWHLPDLKIQCLKPEEAEKLFLTKFDSLFR